LLRLEMRFIGVKVDCFIEFPFQLVSGMSSIQSIQRN
jgi:hypothetical protein